MNQWVLLAAAMVAMLAVLYIPGYFFCRGMRFSRIISATSAPVISASFLVVLPIVFSKLRIACNGLLIVGLTLLACLAVFGVSRAVLARSTRAAAEGGPAAPVVRGCVLDVSDCSTVRIGSRTFSFEWLVLAAYVLFGIFVAWYMVVSNLGTADAFYCRWDNTTHINTLRAFMDTGNWSTLEVDSYAASLPNQIAYESHGGFYPAAWHDAVVTVASLTGISPLIVANALDAVLIGVVYPSGMFLMMKALLPGERRVIAAGSVICVSYAAFPWAFFLYGPYVANLYGQALLPSTLAVFMLYLTSRLVLKKPVSFVLFGVLSVIALAVAHPNTLFTALLYLGAFMCSYVYHAVGESNLTLFGSKRAAQVVAVLGVVAVVVAIWAYCMFLPALHNVVFFGRSVNSSVKHAVWTIATQALSIARHPMYALAVLTVVGGLVCLRKKLWWILVPIVEMALAYVAIRSSESMLKNILGGFWYADVRRVTANMCMFLVPVTSIGADTCVTWICDVLDRLSNRRGMQRMVASPVRDYVVIAVLGAFFLFVNFTPWIPVPWGDGKVNTGIGSIRDELHAMFTPDEEQIYSHVERAFVDKVAQTVPEGELVLNMPHDGSVFAYGFNGLNTYFRSCRPRGTTKEGELIRTRLVNYATDPEVQEAVENTGARYFMQLDQGGTVEDRPWLVQYVNERYNTGPEHWEGLNAIRDDTLGFTVVLSEGDMRLFRIDSIQ